MVQLAVKTGHQESIVVSAESRVEDVGDEALLILRRTKCPVIVDVDRVAATKKLLELYGSDVVISDDGMQHYRLSRYLEIALFDSIGLGNRFLLPAGPLREPLSRLKEADFVIENFNTTSYLRSFDDEYSMFLELTVFRNLRDPSLVNSADDFKGQVVHAVAGIGRPAKFFQSLEQLGLDIVKHPFPDHYQFSSADFSFGNEIVIMTEKDAVKCATIAGSNFWYAEVEAKPSDDFIGELLRRLHQYS